ncbi:hypothetical protein CCMA1212_007373 [Trichoderma ghanense]|uniref:Uncharacterized protein n=1 Tax=Trichoderma ghanense TaxID=65468 RepID=A0ABY2GY20_9HYPO
MAQAHLQDDSDETSASHAGPEDFGQIMKSVHITPSLLDMPKNLEFMTNQVETCIYSLMSRDVKKLDLGLNLAQLGVGSLVAIEIRNW